MTLPRNERTINVVKKSPKRVPVKNGAIELQKFGGTDDLGSGKLDGNDHELQSIEVKSKTKLTDDPYEGAVAVIRRFTFGANPQAFQELLPTKQELFNSHVKGIEIALWRDGMVFHDKVEPQIHFDQKKLQYHIFVGAKPAKGHIVPYNLKPANLKDFSHV